MNKLFTRPYWKYLVAGAAFSYFPAVHWALRHNLETTALLAGIAIVGFTSFLLDQRPR